jgi:hypothetical protein
MKQNNKTKQQNPGDWRKNRVAFYKLREKRISKTREWSVNKDLHR